MEGLQSPIPPKPKFCDEIGCTVFPKCYTNFLPFYDIGSSIASVVTGEGIPSPKKVSGRLLSEQIIADGGSSPGWLLHNKVPDDIVNVQFGILDHKVYYKVIAYLMIFLNDETRRL